MQYYFEFGALREQGAEALATAVLAECGVRCGDDGRTGDLQIIVVVVGVDETMMCGVCCVWFIVRASNNVTW